MEDADYAFGAADLCAAGFGGAHIRQRLWFVGVADTGGKRRDRVNARVRKQKAAHAQDDRRGAFDGLGGQLASRVQSKFVGVADTYNTRPQGWGRMPKRAGECVAGAGGVDDGLANAPLDGRRQGVEDGGRLRSGNREEGTAGRSAINSDLSGGLADAEHHDGRPIQQERRQEGRTADGRNCAGAGGNGHDRPHAPMLGRNAADWLYCRDDKWRPVEPGTFPLVDAAASRVGRLRAYGNGLDAETATQFVGAVMDCAP